MIGLVDILSLVLFEYNVNQLLSCALLIYWSWEKVIDFYSLGWVGVSSVLWTVLGSPPSALDIFCVRLRLRIGFGFLADGLPDRIALFFPVVVAVIASRGRFVVHQWSSEFYFLTVYCSGYSTFLFAWGCL